MKSKVSFLFTLIVLLSHLGLAASVNELPLDFSLRGSEIKEGQIIFGWNLMKWEDWMKRSSSGPLIIPGHLGNYALEVFEARGAAVVSRPVSFFTKEYLQNISTVRTLNPLNGHQQLPGDKFIVETVIPLPEEWAKLISLGKATKLLDEKSEGQLKMTSVFGYRNAEQITSDPGLKLIVQLLDVVGRVPQAISIQSIVKINEIAQFGSIITFFYDLGNNRTLIVNYFSLAIKRKVLNLGLDLGGLNLTGRSLILGQNSILNSDSGIGAGLPKYSLELFQEMYGEFNK